MKEGKEGVYEPTSSLASSHSSPSGGNNSCRGSNNNQNTNNKDSSSNSATQDCEKNDEAHGNGPCSRSKRMDLSSSDSVTTAGRARHRAGSPSMKDFFFFCSSNEGSLRHASDTHSNSHQGMEGHHHHHQSALQRSILSGENSGQRNRDKESSIRPTSPVYTTDLPPTSTSAPDGSGRAVCTPVAHHRYHSEEISVSRWAKLSAPRTPEAATRFPVEQSAGIDGTRSKASRGTRSGGRAAVYDLRFISRSPMDSPGDVRQRQQHRDVARGSSGVSPFLLPSSSFEKARSNNGNNNNNETGEDCLAQSVSGLVPAGNNWTPMYSYTSPPCSGLMDSPGLPGSTAVARQARREGIADAQSGDNSVFSHINCANSTLKKKQRADVAWLSRAALETELSLDILYTPPDLSLSRSHNEKMRNDEREDDPTSAEGREDAMAALAGMVEPLNSGLGNEGRHENTLPTKEDRSGTRNAIDHVFHRERAFPLIYASLDEQWPPSTTLQTEHTPARAAAGVAASTGNDTIEQGKKPHMFASLGPPFSSSLVATRKTGNHLRDTESAKDAASRNSSGERMRVNTDLQARVPPFRKRPLLVPLSPPPSTDSNPEKEPSS